MNQFKKSRTAQQIKICVLNTQHLIQLYKLYLIHQEQNVYFMKGIHLPFFQWKNNWSTLSQTQQLKDFKRLSTFKKQNLRNELFLLQQTNTVHCYPFYITGHCIYGKKCSLIHTNLIK